MKIVNKSKIIFKANNNIYKHNKLSFSLTGKLKEFLKGRKEEINKKNNLINTLDVFKTNQFNTKLDKEKDINIEYSQSTTMVSDKFLNFRERKELKISPLNRDQIQVIEEVKDKIVKSNIENQIKTYKKVEVLTVWEKLDYYEATSDGKIINPYLGDA